MNKSPTKLDLRRNFSRFDIPDVKIPELLELQQKSYIEFLQKDTLPSKREDIGLHGVFKQIFPISNKNMTLSYECYSITEPEISVEETKRRDLTYAYGLVLKLKLTKYKLEEGNKIIESENIQDIYLGHIPAITPESTFIISGIERVMVSQLQKSSGVFFVSKPTLTGSSYDAKIIPASGCWIEIVFDSKNILQVKIDKRKKMLLTDFIMLFKSEQEITPEKSSYETFKNTTESELIDLFYTTTRYTYKDGFWHFTLDDNHKNMTFPCALLNEDESIAIHSHVKLVNQLYRTNKGKIFKISRADLQHFYLGEDLLTYKKGTSVKTELENDLTQIETVLLLNCFKENKYIINTLSASKQIDKDSLFIHAGKILRNGDSIKPETGYHLVQMLLDSNYGKYSLGAVGRMMLNKRLGLTLPYNENSLTRSDIIASVKMLLDITNGMQEPTSIDSLENRRVRSVGELIANQCSNALTKMVPTIIDKMNGFDDTNPAMPSDFISSRSFISNVMELFTLSQLSQLMDSTNPLSSMSHKRRLSSFGEGGLNKDRNWLDLREIHPSQYGRICSTETPEGQSVGLINSITVFANINKYGFMTTPYHPVVNRKVDRSKVINMTPLEDKNFLIAHADPKMIDEEGNILGDYIRCRQYEDYLFASPDKVQFIDVSPNQIMSVSSSLIPFLEHTDTVRALTGANMQRQAVPLVRTEAPLIGTGMEKNVKDMCIFARRAGRVVEIDATKIIIQNDVLEFDYYKLEKFQKTNDGTCFNSHVKVSLNEEVAAGQLLADGASSSYGELALGQNVKVAFLSYRGLNYLDAVVISSKLVKRFTSIHISKHEIVIRETRQGAEEITRNLHGVNDRALMHLDESGIVQIGSVVKEGDILVGRLTPKAEETISAEKRLIRAVFGGYGSDMKDTSLRVPPGCSGTVQDVQIFNRKGMQKLDRAIAADKAMHKKLKEQMDTKIRLMKRALKDKLFDLIIDIPLVNKLGKFSKGDVLTKVNIEEVSTNDLLNYKYGSTEYTAYIKDFRLKEEQLEKEFNQEIDNLVKGDELPVGVLYKIQIFIAYHHKIQSGDKIAGRHGNKGVIAKILHPADMPYLADGSNIDIILTSLGISSRMNLGQILETHLGWASYNLGRKITSFLNQLHELQKQDQHNKQDTTTNTIGELRNFVGEIYKDSPIKQKLEQQEDSEFVKTVSQLKKGIPFASPAFDSPSLQEIERLLKLAGCDSTGQEYLYDGLTGQRFDNKVTVGIMYILQLHHLVTKKMHARSTGTYTLVSQQPLGGRSMGGGQRFGEMERWALQGYGAAYTIREMLTSKSDSATGRVRVFEEMIKGYQIFDQPGLPESFRVLISEIEAIGFKISRLVKQPDGEFEVQDNASEDAFDALKITLAGPDQIIAESQGEVEKSETVHYSNMKADPHGLSSEVIFGPTRNYRCLCGRYNKMKYAGIICEVCKVQVTSAHVRRTRTGHITLASPVAHIWFTKIAPNRLAIVLNMSTADINSILIFEKYVVINPGISPYEVGTLLTENEYEETKIHYAHSEFSAETGAVALEQMLKNLDLEAEISLTREILKTTNSLKQMRRLKILKSFQENNIRPEWMMIRVLRVLPADLRPVIMLQTGRFASSDVTELYRSVINRNNRLKKFLAIPSVPKIIIRHELLMLQAAVWALFDNSKQARPITSTNGKRVLKSLSESFKGKTGRFRYNLLGKRVDYSGRSVIVSGPHLQFSQCGLPRNMALELFKPMVLARLEIRGFASTLHMAKLLYEKKRPEVWSILEEVTREHQVLLNRAPTLFKLGIQAFDIVLTNSNAIELHPLTCAAFNADYDGDTMAVFLPLCIEAQIEARMLMMSTYGLLNPSNGSIIAKPKHDMVLGIYASTLIESNSEYRDNQLFPNKQSAEKAFLIKQINITTPIKMLIKDKIYTTTLGRLRLFEIMPEGIDFDLVNCPIDSKGINNILHLIFKNYGREILAEFLQNLMNLSFEAATYSGDSFGYKDLIIPTEKPALIAKARNQIEEYEEKHEMGFITDRELRNKTLQTWSDFTDQVFEIMIESMKKLRNGKMNSIYKMAISGARGSNLQILQLCGTKGIITKADGVCTAPIIPSLTEGMTTGDYINACQGSRKGLADTALKTATSGYFTRRLISGAQDCVIAENDCNTTDSIEVKAMMYGSGITQSLGNKIWGRVTAEDIINPLTGELLFTKGKLISYDDAQLIDKSNVMSARVRSVITCKSRGKAICQKCYGIDLTTWKMVNLGEAVGVIAGQSLGEPTTQLTLNTFHSGGMAQNLSGYFELKATVPGIASFKKLNVVTNKGKTYVIGRNDALEILNNHGIKIGEISIPYGAQIFVQDGQSLQVDDVIVEWDEYTLPWIARVPGKVIARNFIEGVTCSKLDDGSYMILDNDSYDKDAPEIILEDINGHQLNLRLCAGDTVFKSDGDTVEAGDILTKRIKGVLKSKDITGGLNKIEELFDVRANLTFCIMTKESGKVKILSDSKRNVVKILNEKEEAIGSYIISKMQILTVNNGDLVNRGDVLCDGKYNLQELLEMRGINSLVEYFVSEVQREYLSQALQVNDKHIEVILRQMLQRVEVTDPANSDYCIGSVLPLVKALQYNDTADEPIKYNRLVYSITKASMSEEESFLSSAAFQDPSRAFTNAALTSSIDYKDKSIQIALIAGLLVELGTGFLRKAIDIEKGLINSMPIKPTIGA